MCCRNRFVGKLRTFRVARKNLKVACSWFYILKTPSIQQKVFIKDMQVLTYFFKSLKEEVLEYTYCHGASDMQPCTIQAAGHLHFNHQEKPYRFQIDASIPFLFIHFLEELNIKHAPCLHTSHPPLHPSTRSFLMHQTFRRSAQHPNQCGQ